MLQKDMGRLRPQASKNAYLAALPPGYVGASTLTFTFQHYYSTVQAYASF